MNTRAQSANYTAARMVIADVSRAVPFGQVASVIADGLMAHIAPEIVEAIGEQISRAAHMRGRT